MEDRRRDRVHCICATMNLMINYCVVPLYSSVRHTKRTIQVRIQALHPSNGLTNVCVVDNVFLDPNTCQHTFNAIAKYNKPYTPLRSCHARSIRIVWMTIIETSSTFYPPCVRIDCKPVLFGVWRSNGKLPYIYA